MTNHLKEKIKSVLKRFYVTWIILYLFIISGAVAFGASVYQKYDEHQLPSGYIELKISKTNYQLGDLVEFTVINHFPTTVYVTNECPKEPLNVYRWVDGEWIELHDTAKDDSECYQEPRNIPIPTEGSRSYNFSDWPNLFKEPGVYRIATAIDHYGDVPFQDFVVLEPATIVEVKKEIAPVAPLALPVPVPLPVEIVPIEEVPVIEIYEEEEYKYEDENNDYEERENENNEGDDEGEDD